MTTISNSIFALHAPELVARQYVPPDVVAGIYVLKKQYLDVMGSASSLDLPLSTCAEMVRCANRARCPLTILGYASYYHGRSKGCVTHLSAKVKTNLIPAKPAVRITTYPYFKMIWFLDRPFSDIHETWKLVIWHRLERDFTAAVLQCGSSHNQRHEGFFNFRRGAKHFVQEWPVTHGPYVCVRKCTSRNLGACWKYLGIARIENRWENHTRESKNQESKCRANAVENVHADVLHK